MAHTKAAGSTKLGRDSKAKRLGVKLYAGEVATPGKIIVRQRGTYYKPGVNTSLGVDHTIFATADGKVEFKKKRKTGYNGSKRQVVLVNVV